MHYKEILVPFIDATRANDTWACDCGDAPIYTRRECNERVPSRKKIILLVPREESCSRSSAFRNSSDEDPLYLRLILRSQCKGPLYLPVTFRYVSSARACRYFHGGIFSQNTIPRSLIPFRLRWFTDRRSTFVCTLPVFYPPNAVIADHGGKFPCISPWCKSKLVKLIEDDVKMKLKEQRIDGLLLVQMQLLASLILHGDRGPPTNPNSNDVSIFRNSSRTLLRHEISPRLFALANGALAARVSDINVGLAEAGVVEAGGVPGAVVEVSYRMKASK